MPIEATTTSEPTTKAKQRHRLPSNPRPITDRFAISVAEAAEMMSVSVRSMKRLVADNPKISVLVGRRRMVVVAKLQRWIESGGING